MRSALVRAQLEALNRIGRYARGLRALERDGHDRDYLRRLAVQGPDALPQIEALTHRRKK